MKATCEDEMGEEREFKNSTEWEDLISDYSGRSLTFTSDKLVAIRGLAKEMEKTRQDGYHEGLWSDDLLGNLVWVRYRKLGRRNPEELEIPSWSWASISGSTFYPKFHIHLGAKVKDNCREATVQN